MFPQVLKLDVGGVPVEWLSWPDAATLYGSCSPTGAVIVPESAAIARIAALFFAVAARL